MTVLVIQLPPRPRLPSRAQGATADSEAAHREYNYSVTSDGFSLTAQGRCTAALLPKADSVVCVLADADVGWHRITLPKAPSSRLAEALVGVLEESLLEDADNTLLAVAPHAAAGQPTWIAAVNLAWLRSELATLERSNVFVDRVVPAIWPDDIASGHFAEAEDTIGSHSGSAITLSWSHTGGVAVMGLEGSLVRHVVPRHGPQGTRWTTTPGAAQEAERWLGTSINVMEMPFRLLQASRTLWNLRQFSLARKSRGLRATRDLYRQFLTPNWRPMRWGLASLALLQVIGLNLWAWRQQAEIKARNDAVTQVLKSTFPQIQAVLDAPLQMQREVQALSAMAGRPGEGDLEPSLQAAAAAWPADRPPVDNLQYKDGRLTLAAAGWTDLQVSQFRATLGTAGWLVDFSEGRLALSRQNTSGTRTGSNR